MCMAAMVWTRLERDSNYMSRRKRTSVGPREAGTEDMSGWTGLVLHGDP